MIVDDYGHHPTEIRATLEVAKDAFTRRTVVVFQPHRYSRVAALFDEFCHAFDHADELVVTEIYPAGEDKIPGVSGKRLAEGIQIAGHQHVRFIADLESVAESLGTEMQPGDLIITLGAGSVTTLSDKLVEGIRARV